MTTITTRDDMLKFLYNHSEVKNIETRDDGILFDLTGEIQMHKLVKRTDYHVSYTNKKDNHTFIILRES